MKIMIVSSLSLWSMDKGKGARSIYQVYKDILDEGHEIFYLTHSNKDSELNSNKIKIFTKKVPFFKLLNYKVINYSSLDYFWTNIFMLNFLLKKAKEIKPDLIYALDGGMVLGTYFLSKKLKKPFIIRQRGTQAVLWNLKNIRIHKLGIFKVIKAWKIWYLPFLIPCTKRIITDDGTMADELALKLGVPRSKFVFWRNGVDKVKINIQKDLLKKKLNLKDEKIIMTVSRLEKWKHVDRLINASPKIIKKNQNIKFIIVGDGGQRKNLEKLVKELKVESKFIFIGAVNQSEIYSYLNIADIFVSLYNLSNLGNPTFEAMYSGKCVIALDVGNTKSVINHKKNGVLLNYKNLKRLPQIITSLLKNESFRNELGKNAKKFAEDNFVSWHKRSMMELELLKKIQKENE